MIGDTLLEVDSLAHAFGGVQAVAGVSLKVTEGMFMGLIGPNGAGKSTLLDCISGQIRSYAGRVRFAGQDITGWPLNRIAALRLIRTYQDSRMFNRLTVLSNLMAAPMGQRGERLDSALFGGWKGEEVSHAHSAIQLATDYGLDVVGDNYANQISGGQRRLTELTRALMLQPKMLLLDEPFAGVSPSNRRRLADQLQALNRSRNLTILMIEHRLEMIDQLCDTTVVMAEGRIIAEGRMADIRKHPEVISAYLGTI
jgi:ABC-type branched-subunit amino acid transport system ATPase component